MADALPLGSAFLRDCLWQTTVCLLLGAAAGVLLRRRPARAHRILVLVLIVAPTVPLLSHAVRTLGWGFFTAPTRAKVAVPMPADPTPEALPIALDVVPTRTSEEAGVADPIVPPGSAATPRVDDAGWSARLEGLTRRDMGWVILTAVWAILSVILLARLVISFASGARLISRARPLVDPQMQRAVHAAATSLGLKTIPRLATVASVRSPLIWCWTRRPVLLLPPADRDRLDEPIGSDSGRVLFERRTSGGVGRWFGAC